MLFAWLLCIPTLSAMSQGRTLSQAEGKPTNLPSQQAAIPRRLLYRTLFASIAHMERDRQESSPAGHVNMIEIEGKVQTRMNLSDLEWRALINTSVRVDQYTQEAMKRAENVASFDRALRQKEGLSFYAETGGRQRLHQMQLELNLRIDADIQTLQKDLGKEASTRVESYLDSTFAHAVHFTQISPADIQARRLHGER
jgi:hypothetical protein